MNCLLGIASACKKVRTKVYLHDSSPTELKLMKLNAICYHDSFLILFCYEKTKKQNNEYKGSVSFSAIG